MTLWTECGRQNPDSYDAADNLASALVDTGRSAEALASADKAIRLSRGKRADPFAIKALALENLGRTQEADEAFQKAVALSPTYREPDSLVKSLIWEREPAEKLRVATLSKSSGRYGSKMTHRRAAEPAAAGARRARDAARLQPHRQGRATPPSPLIGVSGCPRGGLNVGGAFTYTDGTTQNTATAATCAR